MASTPVTAVTAGGTRGVNCGLHAELGRIGQDRGKNGDLHLGADQRSESAINQSGLHQAKVGDQK